MDGGFVIIGFPEVADPDVVYLESQAGSLYLEDVPAMDRYNLVFNHLRAMAELGFETARTNPGGPTLNFTRDEWNVFLEGAKAGQFDFG
jgi:hypothetical protein